MSIIKNVVFAALACVLLSSCAPRRPSVSTSPDRQITIKTNGSEITTEPPATSETLNTPEFSFTTPAPTSPPETMPPRTSADTQPSTAKNTEDDRPPESSPSGEEDDYDITPISETYYATSSVNVREKPDADSKRIGHLDKGEEVKVTGLVSNGWAQVEFKDGTYYVNASYLSPSAPERVPETTTAPTETTPPTTEPPVTTPPETTPEPTTIETEEMSSYEVLDAEGVATVKENLNVRTLPDASGEKVGLLHAGERVAITGIVSNGWVRISYNGGQYFVSGEYLSFEEESSEDIYENAPGNGDPGLYQGTGLLTGSNGYTALNYSNQKAVWFAFLDIDGMLKNADKSSFKSKIGSAFDDVVALGCNTVYVHVRSYGDAYYYSDYFPFTAAYNDVLGSAPPFDPLEVMIDEAHSRGLSFHAWINPMRTATKERYAQMPQSYILKQWYDSDSTKGKFIVYDSDTGCYWLSPAYTAVRELICNGVAEIVTRYNVDAIHIDDYFYPTTSSKFDKDAFEASGAKDLASWRRQTVSRLVSDIYSTVKSCNPSVLFGVSPQGNVENNYGQLYADVATWCSTPGYLDYVVPQIYYGFNNSRLPFESCAEQWADMVTLPGVQLVCGIAAYKVGDGGEWSSGDILSEQTDCVAGISAFDGVAYFRYLSLYGSASSSQMLMKKELEKLPESISRF